jgi:aminoglycoside phosphotransferase (APT) family kinase protein
MSDDMAQHLQALCADACDDWRGGRVRNLRCISSGWESDVYSFDLEHGQAHRTGLILRLYPGDDARDKSAREFRSLRLLREAGYPVPETFLLRIEDSPFGQPLVIMERVDGELLWPLMSRSHGERSDRLLTLFCDLFVRLHALDWRPFADDALLQVGQDSPRALVEGQLAWFRAQVESFGMIGFRPVLDWLQARLGQVYDYRLSRVHWDFHPGNIILRPDGPPVVIDWTGLEVSDPRLDLGWTLLLVGAYLGADWRERILREYEWLAGAPMQDMEFFDVASCVRRLHDVTVSVARGAAAMGMRPGAEETMKEQMPATRWVYALLLERTGIRVPEVEAMLASA